MRKSGEVFEQGLAKIFTLSNMFHAWEKVAVKNGAAGFDHVKIEEFARRCDSELQRLRQEVLSGHYTAQPLICFAKKKANGGERELAIASVRDRVVCRVLSDHLVETYNNKLQPQSYAYRPHRGALKAVAAAHHGCQQARYVARIDIHHFFDSINHEILQATLHRMEVAENETELIMRLIAAKRFDGIEMKAWVCGIPQGLPLAPVISNLYLDPFDQALTKAGLKFIRYADDILIFGEDADTASGGMSICTEELGNLKLKPAAEKSRVYSIEEGFVFLGFIFNHTGHTPCDEAQRRLQKKQGDLPYDDESREEYEQRIASAVRGWHNYFDTTDKSPVRSEPQSGHQGNGNREENHGNDILSQEEQLDQIHKQELAGRPGDAAGRLRRLINREGETLSPEKRRELLELLADIYEHQGLYGAARKCRGESQMVPVIDNIEPPVKYNPKDVERWLDIFGGGEGPVYRQYIDQLGRCGFRPGLSGLTPNMLLHHWKGLHTLAVPIYNRNNQVRFGVIDIDISRETLDGLDAAGLTELKEHLLDDARGIWAKAREANLYGLIEDSGYKGYHVWFFFQKWTDATVAKKMIFELSRITGEPPAGSHRELFPASGAHSSAGLGDRVKLPLGIHMATGRKSAFLDGGGEILSDGTACFRHGFGITDRGIRTAIARWNHGPEQERHWIMPIDSETRPTASESEQDDTCGLLMRKCSVLAAIEQKARTTNHLGHAERIVLRGILAPLGDCGRKTIHEILRYCHNYDYQITERNLGAGKFTRPMSCSCIREALGNFCDICGCSCSFKPRKGEYDHPLRHLGKKEEIEIKTPAARQEHSNQSAEIESEPEPDSNISGLLGRIRKARQELLNLQYQLMAAMKGKESVELEIGTLKCAGIDQEIKSWQIMVN